MSQNVSTSICTDPHDDVHVDPPRQPTTGEIDEHDNHKTFENSDDSKKDKRSNMLISKL